ncbi:dihydrolipoamide acetyltransferase component of pyruvate dehydrogenase complex [Paraliobacillus quinghaiensis]|uniref:Dihydrolipoamide acetyltransferase component of pyruvate dehydrogenase complex n=1 Tax=Paraliobacillus quinghaiensis TaxID=470815 RepID=A0A917WQW3_9BACI|nr:dihydrolipoamide acetyltransferase family protein [Paraliobacillus quinghaiensis]GGM22166.1 dihydrolipoamide acetyltransferase component of pyruvate dehydrogenase complex [Paraliobacillus quinghaiensis]
MSLEKITMPQLGESVTEGTISNWLVQVGDRVEKYEAIAEVMTDKVNAEVPSSFTGTIKELVAEEEQTIEVGELMCYIDVEGQTSTEATIEKAEVPEQNQSPESTKVMAMKARYSPAVMRLAQENAIDLNKVNGSGRGGRITRKDLERIIAEPPTEKQEDAPTVEINEQIKTKPSKQPVQAAKGDREIPVTGIRKAIATNMVRSTTEIPHAWMMIEVDVTNLVKYRDAEKTKFKQNEGYNLSYFAFFLNAVAKALKKFPELNSSWAGDKIIQHKEINLSVAVAHDKELFVPVIKNVDEKSIKGIAKEIDSLAIKARNGNLTQQDMEGGTFTVNNTGSFGSVQSMGVINYPQAAILQVESIVKRPVIIDDMFAARDMVNLCLSLDHRILDGVICGQFMSHIKEILENISGDTTPIF